MKNNNHHIKNWPETERPRERLLRMGAQALTDAELIAILLRVGIQGTSAVELARHINSGHSVRFFLIEEENCLKILCWLSV